MNTAGNQLAENDESVNRRKQYKAQWRLKNKDRLTKKDAERYQANKEEIKARSKAWYKANPERRKSGRKAWGEANKESLRIKKREKYLQNRDVMKQRSRSNYLKSPQKRKDYAKSYRINNPQKRKSDARAYWAKNRVRLNAKSAAWGRAHKPQRAAAAQRRRAVQLKAQIGDQKLVSEWIGHTKAKKRVACFWCRTIGVGAQMHIDHILALAKGGAHEVGNLCVSCPRCNFTKNAKSLNEWNSEILEPVLL